MAEPHAARPPAWLPQRLFEITPQNDPSITANGGACVISGPAEDGDRAGDGGGRQSQRDEGLHGQADTRTARVSRCSDRRL